MTGRMLIKGVVASILCASFSGVAFAQSEPQTNCAEPTTQADMNICASRDYEAADKALNAQYQSIRKILTERDSTASNMDKGAVEALVAAQRAWIAYRDANCDAVGFQARGGSMEPMLVSSCLAEMSRNRAEELKTLSEGF